MYAFFLYDPRGRPLVQRVCMCTYARRGSSFISPGFFALSLFPSTSLTFTFAALKELRGFAPFTSAGDLYFYANACRVFSLSLMLLLLLLLLRASSAWCAVYNGACVLERGGGRDVAIPTVFRLAEIYSIYTGDSVVHYTWESVSLLFQRYNTLCKVRQFRFFNSFDCASCVRISLCARGRGFKKKTCLICI